MLPPSSSSTFPISDEFVANGTVGVASFVTLCDGVSATTSLHSPSSISLRTPSNTSSRRFDSFACKRPSKTSSPSGKISSSLHSCLRKSSNISSAVASGGTTGDSVFAFSCPAF
ncbi:hypothetical protein V8G54_002221 [Vigna mungo]|uniref:Uncharacterized protein n=1 Tax=Vigna mungo TaxID=3915 RepID=A0AAQ3PAY5_VIGMU